MRAMIDGLESAHPIGLELPGLYQDDDFTQRFTAALDAVLAPIFITLDAVEAYIDPWLAPEDFLDWLSDWVGITIDPDLPEARQRAVVARAAELFTWAGTTKGITDLVETYTGVRPDVTDSGGVAWSAYPGGDIPGTDAGTVTVRLRLPKGESVEQARIERLLAAVLPATVVATVEVTSA